MFRLNLLIFNRIRAKENKYFDSFLTAFVFLLLGGPLGFIAFGYLIYAFSFSYTGIIFFEKDHDVESHEEIFFLPYKKVDYVKACFQNVFFLIMLVFLALLVLNSMIQPWENSDLIYLLGIKTFKFYFICIAIVLIILGGLQYLASTGLTSKVLTNPRLIPVGFVISGLIAVTLMITLNIKITKQVSAVAMILSVIIYFAFYVSSIKKTQKRS